MRTLTTHAYARAGLLGNPSDGFDGKAIAISVRNFRATVTLEEAERFEIVPGAADLLEGENLREYARGLAEDGCYGGIRLIKAAIKKVFDHFGEIDGADRAAFRISYDSDIPRQVGMSGSSAIVIAAMRGVIEWLGLTIEPATLAELALAAEVEELGISAGPMDRVIQSYEGVVAMDFTPPRRAENYRRLDPELLPPLFMAYDPRTGETSGKVHSNVKSRWLAGDPEVRDAIAVFPSLVDEGVACLERGDLDRFRELMDINFDTRAKIWTLGERDKEMVAIGRGASAAVKFSGSGGAVIGAMKSQADFESVRAAYRAKGYEVIQPQIQLPA